MSQYGCIGGREGVCGGVKQAVEAVSAPRVAALIRAGVVEPPVTRGSRLTLVNEWLATGASLIGSAWLALQLPGMGWAFCCYAVANICWIIFALRRRVWGLVLTQAGFMVTSLIGILTWFHFI